MLEHFRATVERTDARGRTHFVAGEGEEIATEFLHIERHVTRALGAIDERERADGARFSAKLRDRVDRADEFETCVKANSFTSGVRSASSSIECERAVLIHRHEAQPRTGAFREQLPGHEVAVMLHFREQNHIAFAQTFRPRLARRG